MRSATSEKTEKLQPAPSNVAPRGYQAPGHAVELGVGKSTMDGRGNGVPILSSRRPIGCRIDQMSKRHARSRPNGLVWFSAYGLQ